MTSSNCVIRSLYCRSECQQLNAQFSSDVSLPRLPACSALKHRFCSANPDLLSSFICGSLFNSNTATQKYKQRNERLEGYANRFPCVTTDIRNKGSLRMHTVTEKFFHRNEKHQVVQTLLLMTRIYSAKQPEKPYLLGNCFQCESTAVEPVHMKQRRKP